MFASHGGADEAVAFLLPTDKKIVNSTASLTSSEALTLSGDQKLPVYPTDKRIINS